MAKERLRVNGKFAKAQTDSKTLTAHVVIDGEKKPLQYDGKPLKIASN